LKILKEAVGDTIRRGSDRGKEKRGHGGPSPKNFGIKKPEDTRPRMKDNKAFSAYIQSYSIICLGSYDPLTSGALNVQSENLFEYNNASIFSRV